MNPVFPQIGHFRKMQAYQPFAKWLQSLRIKDSALHPFVVTLHDPLTRGLKLRIKNSLGGERSRLFAFVNFYDLRESLAAALAKTSI